MKAYPCGAFILPGFRDHNLFLRAEAVRLKTEDLTLTMEIRIPNSLLLAHLNGNGRERRLPLCPRYRASIRVGYICRR